MLKFVNVLVVMSLLPRMFQIVKATIELCKENSLHCMNLNFIETHLTNQDLNYTNQQEIS